MKWNSDQIIKFLDIYERYEVLWDIRNKDHMNKLKRDVGFDKLLQEVLELSDFEGLDMIILKTKIKTIKTVYRQELNKIIKSKKSGAGAADVYKPKLVWFIKADSFLHNVTTTRKTSSNMNISVNSGDEDTLEDEEGDQQHQQTTTRATSGSSKETVITPKHIASPKMKPPAQTPKRKREALELNKTIAALHDVAKLNEGRVDDEYDSFAQHIANQMRQLPIRSFIMLQEDIQRLITRERLRFLSDSVSTPQINVSNYGQINEDSAMTDRQQHYYDMDSSRPSSSHSGSSQTHSQYSDNDILQQALSAIDYNVI